MAFNYRNINQREGSLIAPHITDELDDSESSKSLPILVVIQAETTSEVADAIRTRAEEIGKTPSELAGLLLSCAVMLWRAGDTAD